MSLVDKKCVPCEGGAQPLPHTEIEQLLGELRLPWEVLEHKKIHHEFVFKDFLEAMAFVKSVAEIAEAEGHHPDLHISYNRVVVELWTHAIGGLSENDFIVAGKIEGVGMTGI